MFVQMKFLPLLIIYCVNEYFLVINTQKTCPVNYSLNASTGECEECDAGYYGKNCSSTCRYPNYGADCQSKCDCKLELCHHISGCDYGFNVATHSAEESDSDIKESGSSKEILIIVLTVGGILLVVVAFVVISTVNRKFFTRHIRNNAHYVASVMAEQSGPVPNASIYHRPASPVITTAADNGLYALANTLRRENTTSPP